MSVRTSRVRGLNLWVGPVDPRLPWSAVAVGANRAFVAAFTVERPVTVSKARFSIGTQSGNMSLGIYTGSASPLTRIATTGAFAVPASGANTQNLSAAVTLVPGVRYWAAISCDNGTATFHWVLPGVSSTLGVAAGLADSQTSASHPLPSSLSLLGTSQSEGSPVVCFS